MTALRYSLSQIEAFTTVAEAGSVSRAAIILGKDRTTVRDLLDYLEDALGYALFTHEGRKLTLTHQGEQLHRQAHLFIRQAHAFESFARSLATPQQQEIRLVYDPFVPKAFLHDVIADLAMRQVRVNLWCASRFEAEEALRTQQADLALCQAINRTLGSEMEWSALGAIELNFYAARSLFATNAQPLTLLDLALVPQLVMHARADEQISQRLQLSGHSLFVNEYSTLRSLMESGQGWAFLPTHFRAEEWKDVTQLTTEVGHQGLSLTLVTLWAPGTIKQPLLGETVARWQQRWRHINAPVA